MVKEKNIPIIRFPGFEDDWKQYKLGEICPVASSKRIHQTDWRKSGIPYLRARDLVDASKGLESKEKLYISEEKYKELLNGKDWVSQGDLLITGVGTLGVPLLVRDKKPLYFKDDTVYWIKNEGINPNFLYYSFLTPSIKRYIKGASGTGTVGNYSLESVRSTPFKLPSFGEQEVIGKFLGNVDQTIALYRSKLDDLKELKNGLLQKMFPQKGEKVPQVRFPGFIGDWEQRQLGDYYEVSSEKNKSGQFGQEDVMSASLGTNLQKKKIFFGLKATEDSVQNYRVVRKTDMIFTKSPIVNHPHGLIKTCFIDEGIVPSLYGVYKQKTQIDPLFVNQYYSLTSRLNSILKPIVNVGARNNVNLSDEGLLEARIDVPSLEEQQKISAFFSQMDETITLHQQKIDELNQLKSGLLQKMFP